MVYFFFNEESGDVTFWWNGMGILSVNVNSIDLDNNFDEDNPVTTILIRLLAWRSNFKKRQSTLKKMSEELMPKAWHFKLWWNFCMSEDEKKKKK